MSTPRRQHFEPATDVESPGHQPSARENTNNVPTADSKEIGTLLYRIDEKQTNWDGNTEWITLEFYEHVIVYRKKAQWCCFPKMYYAEAIPRFKVVNVTFTNGRRNLFWWIFILAMIGALLIVFGMLLLPSTTGEIMRIVGIVLLAVSPVPLIFCSKWRYVTFDIKGLHSGGGWFSKAKIYSFHFSESKPDEDFIVNYIYSPLQKGCTQIHALSHYNSAALAAPLNSELRTSMKAEDWLLPHKQWTSHQHRRGRGDYNSHPHIVPTTYDESEPYSDVEYEYDQETPEDFPIARTMEADIRPAVRAQRVPKRHPQPYGA